jgi:hypothetical protein
VIIVNQAFVRRHSPAKIRSGGKRQGGVTRTIVGVAGDVQQKVAFGNTVPSARRRRPTCRKRR